MAAGREKRKIEVVLKEMEGERRLVEAANTGDLEAASLLIQSGVSVDAVDYNKHLFYQSENYMTPLQYATAKGFPELVQLFIGFNADVNAKDRFDVTALHVAAEMGHVDCMKLLLDGNADCNIATKYSKHGSYTAVPHPGGTTPLHLAAANDHNACVKLLILNGADYNAVDEQCRTSLYIAAQKGYEACVHAHLDSAIWKDILSIPVKATGDTPLHECVRQNLPSCVRKLLLHGSDVNHRNLAGYSPLHLSVRNGEQFSMEILRCLVTQGYNTDVNIPDAKGMDLLQHRFTISNWALKQPNSGFCPLHYVCFNEVVLQERRPEAAAILLAYGADFKIRNKQGDNVLQSELRSRIRDFTILYTIAKCTAYLPSLECLGLGLLNSNPVSSVPPAQQQPMMARLMCSENQFVKLNWYKDLLKKPRSLQHYCRCVIRDSMGVQRLRKINCLPLPVTLKEFLLLEHQEFV